MADDKETPEEQITREAAALKDANTAPEAKQTVKKQTVKKPKSAEEDASAFEGQVIQTDDWNITTGDNLGRPLVKITPVGWVGDAPLTIHGEKLEGLIKALQKIKSYSK